MSQNVFNIQNMKDSLLKRALLQKRPYRCTLELTYNCNFHCKMCYIRMTDKQAKPFGRLRTVDEWLNMAQQMADSEVLNLSLTGGECTLYPGFTELYPELCKLGFQVSLFTNAGGYDSSIYKVLDDYPPRSVSISLYGANNETYRCITGDPRGFSKTLDSILFYKQHNVPIQLTYTMTRQNAYDYPGIDKLCADLGLHYVLNTDLVLHQKNHSFSDAQSSRLSPAESACILCHPPEEINTALLNSAELEKELISFKPSENGDICPPGKSIANTCVAAFSSCAIYWNGDMNTCVALSGNTPVKPFEIGFENAWQQLQEKNKSTFVLPKACISCDMKSDCIRHCPGRNFEGTGDPLTPDPEICKYTFLLRKYREKLKNPPELPPSPPCS